MHMGDNVDVWSLVCLLVQGVTYDLQLELYLLSQKVVLENCTTLFCTPAKMTLLPPLNNSH